MASPSDEDATSEGQDITGKTKATKQFISDMEMDEHPLTWKILRFPTLLKRDKWINSKTCEFEAGSVLLGRDKVKATKIPLKWRLNLIANNEEESNMNWIGISLHCLIPDHHSTTTTEPIDIINTIAECTFVINNSGFFYCEYCDETFDGHSACPNCSTDYVQPTAIIKTLGPSSIDQFKKGLTCRNLIEKQYISSYIGNQETECLCICCTLKLLKVPSEPALLFTEVSFGDFQAASQVKVQQEFKKLLENEIPCNDVTILTEDKQEFKVQWGILAARSPFFKNMYNSKMKETETGVIHLPDISGKTFEVLRHFIYTGELLSNKWRDSEVVPELINAAAKYMLSDLLEYLDGALGSICNAQTALPFLALAQKFSLKKAEKGLLDWIKEHEMGSAEGFLKMWQTLQEQVQQKQEKVQQEPMHVQQAQMQVQQGPDQSKKITEKEKETENENKNNAVIASTSESKSS